MPAETMPVDKVHYYDMFRWNNNPYGIQDNVTNTPRFSYTTNTGYNDPLSLAFIRKRLLYHIFGSFLNSSNSESTSETTKLSTPHLSRFLRLYLHDR